MIINAYSIFDSKSNTFGPILLFVNNDVAIRYAIHAVKTIPEVGEFASDYVLHLLGAFDQATGVLDQSIAERIGTLDSLSTK